VGWLFFGCLLVYMCCTEVVLVNITTQYLFYCARKI
jgi:hypothetical protein